MGRLSKFGLPIPGRKNRPVAEPQPEISTSKANKILGTTAINVDSSVQWDTKPSSGMSVAMPESTTGHYPDRALENVPRVESQWDEESEMVPSHVGKSEPGTSSGYSNPNDSLADPSDISSLRKRQSSSTIMSYHDKSRVPLSISQQTSSAMAKGLPTKATSILDIDGSIASPAPNAKPAKRDIPSIFSRPRTGGSNKSAPGNDYIQEFSPPHPSVRHRSSHQTLGSVKTEREISRKSTRQRLHEFTGRGPSKNPAPEAPVHKASVNRMGVKEAMDLNQLYNHYEQMSFRQVMGDEEIPEGAVDEPSQNQPSEEPEILDLPLPPSPQFATPRRKGSDAEYATSISSRHTRTSKASKKTTPSFMESDLHQQSVLSLSSESEDEGYVEQSKPSPSPVTSRGGATDEEAVPFAERRRSTASKSSANSAKSGRSGKRAPFASRNTYLTIPTEPLPPCPPEIARRTSSLAHRPSNATASSVRSSRVSVMSTSTTGSASQHLQDARVMPMPPAPHAHGKGDDRRSETPVRSRRGSARSVETPPLSPKSVEPHLDGQDASDSRFMAVSRQEEMLLAALRMKRARMRANTLSELEEEDRIDSLPSASPANNDAQDPGAYAAPVRAIQKKGSKSSVSTARTETKSPRYGAPRSSRVDMQQVSPPPSGPLPEPGASKKKLSLQSQRKSSDAGHEGPMLDLDGNNPEEPSPDLSDFMDFDNGSEGTDGQSTQGQDGKGTGARTPVTPNNATPSPALGPQKKGGFEGLHVVTEETTPEVPRPDSPISPQIPLFPMPGGSRKGVRLSAVGGVGGMEPPWWGDDD
ncbi:hypothetical protein VUR80DRAFT_7761 [Thermomyces stellatus]